MYRKIFTNKSKNSKKNKEETIPSDFELFKDIEITSKDNLKLCGKYKDNGCDRLVIIIHNYGENSISKKDYVKIFDKRNYDILVIDSRGCGKSEGENITLGLKESEDLLLWIKKMIEIKSNYKIILYGFGMGASTIYLLPWNELPKNIVAFIGDSGYDSAEKEIKFLFSKYKLISNILYKILYNYAKKSENFDIKKVDCTFKLKNCKLPALFIHCEKDEIVPVEMVYNLSSILPDNRKDVFISSASGHCKSYVDNPKEYEREIGHFLSKYGM